MRVKSRDFSQSACWPSRSPFSQSPIVLFAASCRTRWPFEPPSPGRYSFLQPAHVLPLRVGGATGARDPGALLAPPPVRPARCHCWRPRRPALEAPRARYRLRLWQGEAQAGVGQHEVGVGVEACQLLPQARRGCAPRVAPPPDRRPMRADVPMAALATSCIALPAPLGQDGRAGCGRATDDAVWAPAAVPVPLDHLRLAQTGPGPPARVGWGPGGLAARGLPPAAVVGMQRGALRAKPVGETQRGPRVAPASG